MTPVVECIGLSKIFKDFWMRPRVTAVDSLDLAVNSGEVFGLLGPNGSGKSTTIKMLLGLLFPTKGRISIFGKDPSSMAVKAQTGYLPEESYLYRFLNARETLDYYGRLFNLGRKQRQQRIDMLLEMVGLQAVQNRPVGEYSKGMQRRIGLAQALINDPDLLILDEPTTGLDPIGTRQIKDLIRMLKSRGKTVLLCSHLLTDVEDVCDRVTVMYGGKVRAMGTVDELLTVADRTVIETDCLEQETIKEVTNVLSGANKKVRSVERPRKRLDELFLEVVEKAQGEDVHTQGAHSKQGIAEFLKAEADTSDDNAEEKEVIAKLMEAKTPETVTDVANLNSHAVKPPTPDLSIDAEPVNEEIKALEAQGPDTASSSKVDASATNASPESTSTTQPDNDVKSISEAQKDLTGKAENTASNSTASDQSTPDSAIDQNVIDQLMKDE